MTTDGQTSQLTPLLGNDVLARLERRRINSSRRFTNRSQGEHLRGRGGTSIEFADYRNYVPGDDVRFVDWNIFARLHRPYLKLYELEEEMHVVLLVDGSSSMGYEGKLELATQLAAAFGMMGLLGDERVSAYAFAAGDDARPRQFKPSVGRANLTNLFAFLEQIEPGGDTPLDEAIEAMLKVHAGRGIVVIVSDFLTFGDLRQPLNRLYSSGLEVFGIQILSPSEIDPDVTGDLRLVDCETLDRLDVSSAADLLTLYQEYRAAYQRNLAVLCQQRSGRFVSVSSEDPVETLLFEHLQRAGWIS